MKAKKRKGATGRLPRHRHGKRKTFRRGRLSRIPACELLEDRWVLTAPTVTELDPPANSLAAPPDGLVSVVFDQTLMAASVTDQSLFVHGTETADLAFAAANPRVDGETVSFLPPRALHPGEFIEVTATDGIQNLDGEGAKSAVWQFRAAVGSGNGLGSGSFRDTGQVLGNGDTYAVALGDLDGDGDLDAFEANGGRFGGAAPDRVWLNDGTGRFRDSGQQFPGSNGSAVALGDLDGDGDLDAFVGNGGSVSPTNEDRVWLNDGLGTFSDSGQRLGSGKTQAIALADLDGDGDLDAFLGNYLHLGTAANRVWLNDGQANFRDSGQLLGDRDTSAVALGDLDGDGDADAFVANGDGLLALLPNEVWLNNGDGTFRDSGQALGAWRSHDVVLGDVDGDGDLDALVANHHLEHISADDEGNRLWLNDGSGTFRDSGQILGKSIRSAVDLGDLDGDGDLDAFIGSENTRHIWTNDGMGNFVNSEQGLGVNDPFARNSTKGVALGDLDGDGDLDAFAAPSQNGSSSMVWINADIAADLAITVSNGQSEMVPGEPVTYTIQATNSGPQGIDGVLVTDRFPSQISDVQWTCAASAGSTCTANGTGDISDTVSLAAGGSVTYTATGSVLSEAASAGSITNRATLAAPPGPRILSDSFLSAEDIDAVLPVMGAEPQPNSIGAAVTTEVSASFREPVDPASLSFETFSVRGMQSGPLTEPPDVLQADQSTVRAIAAQPYLPGELVQVTATRGIRFQNGQSLASPNVWEFRTAVGTGNEKGSGAFGDTFQDLGNTRTRDVALADFDGDGDLDALFANSQKYDPFPNTVWWNDGAGGFRDSGQRLGNDLSWAVAAGDLDGDGDVDALVAPNQVWLNDGRGMFAAGERLEDADGHSVALGDLDRDGDLDAFFGSFGVGSVWLNDGTGAFVKTEQSFTRDSTADVALGDLDGDGDLDAFLAGRWDTPTTVWRNDGFGRFVDTGQRLDSSYSTSAVLGDLDGDGDLDAVVGNITDRPPGVTNWLNDGNGFFTGTGQRLGDTSTLAVDVGDLDGDGDLDIVAGNMSFQLDLIEPEIEPRPNSIWLNDGAGNFTENGQRPGDAATFAVVLGDLDGDGDLDLIEGNDRSNRVWLNADRAGADLSVSIHNDRTTVQPGEPVEYVITVANDGPHDFRGAEVRVRVAPQITATTWTCAASDGSVCGDNGTGDIAEIITILAGGRVTYSVTGVLGATANTTIEMTAEVSAPPDATELDPRNNRSEYRDVVAPLSANPAPNTNSAPVRGDIVLTYNRPIDPTTVSERTFAVHGMQSGQLRERFGTFSVAGNTISAAAAQPFHPGEMISVTASQRIENADGQGPISPYVLQFRAAVGQGNGKGLGVFIPNGENLSSEADSRTVLGDMDSDGDLDAIVNDELWLNDGAGNFRNTGQGGPQSSFVAVGDLDGDGDLDMIADGVIRFNDGTGVLEDLGKRLEETDIESMVLGDVDGDGDLDVVVGRRKGVYLQAFGNTYYSGAPGKVWLNDGRANFRDSGQELTTAFTRAVALGDLDGDGDLDLVIAVSRAEFGEGRADRVWLNDGNGLFRDTGQSLGDTDTFDLELGDVDGDGDLDLLTGNALYEFPFENNRRGERHPAPNRIWLNDGNANFSDSGQRLGNEFTRGVALGDVDGDGDLDALFANSYRGDFPTEMAGTDQVWRNDGNGNFTEGERHLADADSFDVALGDLDGDGDLDALFAGSTSGNDVWLNVDTHPTDLSIELTNEQSVTFPGQTVLYTVTASNHGPEDVAGAVVVAEFAPQLTNVTWTCAAPAGATCSPSGAGNIRDVTSLAAGTPVVYSIEGTVDPAANVTIVSRASILASDMYTELDPSNNIASHVIVMPPQSVQPAPNSHSHSVSGPITLTSLRDVDPTSVDAGSLVVHGTQSGRLVATTATFDVTNSVVSVTPNQPLYPGELVSATVTGNVENLDGQGPVSPYVWQFRTTVGRGNGRGTANFINIGQELIGSERADDVVLGDFDGDGDLDAIAGSSPKVWLNDGRAGFHDTGQTLGTNAGDALAVADLDGDGDLDVVTRSGPKENNVWLNDGTGTFLESQGRMGGNNIGAMALGDFDGDGDVDGLVTKSGESSSVWLNDGRAHFSPRIIRSMKLPIALGDLDQDGDLDAVIGDQIWLNDGAANFTARPERLPNISPFRGVHLGDVDGDGDLDIVTSGGRENNKLWRNNGQGEFDAGEPVFGETGKSDVALGDLDGDGDLDVFAVRYRLVEVWRNDGQGGFTGDAHDADHWGVAVALGDLDGDGDLDAFVGNYRDPAEVWVHQNAIPFAVWDGDAPVGTPGDGATWDDANNWTVDGRPDVAPNDFADITFKTAPSAAPIQLGEQRRVGSLTFESDVALQGGTLVMSSGEIHVNPSVTATIHADADDSIKKLGDGTLVLTGDVSDIRVDSGTVVIDGTAQSVSVIQGTVTGGGTVSSLTVESDGTLSVGPSRQTLSVTQATISGTLVAYEGGPTDVLNVPLETLEALSLLPGSTLDVKVVSPFDAVGEHVRQIIGVARLSGQFTQQPAVGDHLGQGVFVSTTGVSYEPSGVWMAMYQAEAGDANGDQKFNERDLMQLLAAGTYFTGQTADWTQGDWNGDGLFDGKDIVAALSANSYSPGG